MAENNNIQDRRHVTKPEEHGFSQQKAEAEKQKKATKAEKVYRPFLFSLFGLYRLRTVHSHHYTFSSAGFSVLPRTPTFGSTVPRQKQPRCSDRGSHNHLRDHHSSPFSRICTGGSRHGYGGKSNPVDQCGKSAKTNGGYQDFTCNGLAS